MSVTRQPKRTARTPQDPLDLGTGFATCGGMNNRSRFILAAYAVLGFGACTAEVRPETPHEVRRERHEERREERREEREERHEEHEHHPEDY